MIQGSISGRCKKFFYLLHNVHTSSGSYPASCSSSNRFLSLRIKWLSAKLTIHLHLVLQLTASGGIPLTLLHAIRLQKGTLLFTIPGLLFQVADNHSFFSSFVIQAFHRHQTQSPQCKNFETGGTFQDAYKISMSRKRRASNLKYYCEQFCMPI